MVRLPSDAGKLKSNCASGPAVRTSGGGGRVSGDRIVASVLKFSLLGAEGSRGGLGSFRARLCA